MYEQVIIHGEAQGATGDDPDRIAGWRGSPAEFGRVSHNLHAYMCPLARPFRRGELRATYVPVAVCCGVSVS